MPIDEHDLLEFIQLYEDEFGESLSLEEAREMASRLVSPYEVLSRPLADEMGWERSEATGDQ